MGWRVRVRIRGRGDEAAHGPERQVQRGGHGLVARKTVAFPAAQTRACRGNAVAENEGLMRILSYLKQ